MNLTILKKGFKGKQCVITSTHGRQKPWQNPQENRCNRPLPNKHPALLEGLMGGNAAAQQFKPPYLLAFTEYEGGHKLRFYRLIQGPAKTHTHAPHPLRCIEGPIAKNIFNFQPNRRHTHD